MWHTGIRPIINQDIHKRKTEQKKNKYTNKHYICRKWAASSLLRESLFFFQSKWNYKRKIVSNRFRGKNETNQIFHEYYLLVQLNGIVFSSFLFMVCRLVWIESEEKNKKKQEEKKKNEEKKEKKELKRKKWNKMKKKNRKKKTKILTRKLFDVHLLFDWNGENHLNYLNVGIRTLSHTLLNSLYVYVCLLIERLALHHRKEIKKNGHVDSHKMFRMYIWVKVPFIKNVFFPTVSVCRFCSRHWDDLWFTNMSIAQFNFHFCNCVFICDCSSKYFQSEIELKWNILLYKKLMMWNIIEYRWYELMKYCNFLF